ncbi:MAG: DUF4168 domain-containing protein [Oculatellaceae cyanobacterium Prado106]|nr:DUF4168 domain-containing protein [Oculatellaceae cyanobacterium Prado106]
MLILVTALLLLSAWGLPAASVWAAETVTPGDIAAPSESAPPNPTGLTVNAISAEKLSQFVQAYQQVIALIDRREGELQGAETESDSFRIKQEIESEARGLIEASGLTFQEYIQLLTLANLDAEVSERIAAQLQEAMD